MTAQPGRRASRRVVVDIPVDYEQAGVVRGTGRIVELAAGGCILKGTVLQPNGSDVFLYVRMGPEKRETLVQGCVVRAKEGLGTALEFVYASAEARETILRYVEQKVAESASRGNSPPRPAGSPG